MKCRGCGGQEFGEVINLGEQYVVGFPKAKNVKAAKGKLHVVRCLRCSLVQLRDTVPPEKLFSEFWYRSGISETMRAALDEIVRRANSAVELKNGDRVLDIGSNDGTLLEMYPPYVQTVGVEPCEELLLESSREHRVDIARIGFFSKGRVEDLAPFKVITAIAMFYDVADPRQFLEDCRDVLADDGLLLIQMNYLKTMLEETTVDNISHEHLTYWSLTTLSHIVESIGMTIAGVETNDVNGGSFRAYIIKKGQGLKGLPIDRQMQLYGTKVNLLHEEAKMGLESDEPYQRFQMLVAQKMSALRGYLEGVKRDGGKLYVYGASTRGTALLQVLDLPEGTFTAAAERDERKYGRVMVSGWIPIKSEQECRAEATHFFVLPYHFRKQIELREQQWSAMGGTLIWPLPWPSVVSEGTERKLVLTRIRTGSGKNIRAEYVNEVPIRG